MGHPKYLFAKKDFKRNVAREEYADEDHMTFSEFKDMIKKLKLGWRKDYKLMRREDMLWLLENNNFEFVIKDKPYYIGEKIIIENNGNKIEINTLAPRGCEITMGIGVDKQSSIFNGDGSISNKLLYFKFKNAVEGKTLEELRKKEGSIHQITMYGEVKSIRFKLMKEKN